MVNMRTLHSVSHFQGRQLTLRYTNETQSKENQAFSLESESTKLKKLHHDDEDSTDVKKLFMHENGFLGSGETFVKGVSHYDRDPEAGSEYNGDRVSKLGGSLGSEVEAYSFSATSLKHVIRSVESKQIDDDDDEIQLKHTSQHETYVKEIYVDVTQDSYEVCGCVDNVILSSFSLITMVLQCHQLLEGL